MLWWIILFALAGVLIIARLYYKVRANLGRSRDESWDASMVERLRANGYAPFNDYQVEFFLALPDATACQAVRDQLEPQGFSVDVKPLENDAQLRYSLHASKLMKLIVPEMQDTSRRLTQLALQFQGRYDGWAV